MWVESVRERLISVILTIKKNGSLLAINRVSDRLPVKLLLLCKRTIQKIIRFYYAGVSLPTHPLTKEPEDPGFKIGHIVEVPTGS